MVEVALTRWPLVSARSDRAADPDRIDADVASEAPVLGRDHRRPHFGRNLIVGEPLPEARPHRHQHLAVRGAHPDHLPEVVALGQFVVAGEVGGRDRDGDDERQNAEKRGITDALDDRHEGGASFGSGAGRGRAIRRLDRKLRRGATIAAVLASPPSAKAKARSWQREG